MNENHPRYFAAQNTTKGFYSYFTEIFDPDRLSRIFIIKGGPGTGKSGIMRSVAALAEEAGEKVERYYCSSDPNSLDGIILPESGSAILDGTSPHTRDPIYPGAVDRIINTGAYWDISALMKHKSEILSLIREGKRQYKRAYGFLNAAGEILLEMQRIASKNLNVEKIDEQIRRLGNKIFQNKEEGLQTIRAISTFNSSGLSRQPGSINSSKKVWLIRDAYNIAPIFLEKLSQYAQSEKQSFIYCPSCLYPDKPDALFFPHSGAAFIPECDEYTDLIKGKEIHILNMHRFISEGEIRSNRQKMKFGKRCVDSLFIGATEAFSEAADTHAKLEKIYTSAMDFTGVNLEIRKIVQEILR